MGGDPKAVIVFWTLNHVEEPKRQHEIHALTRQRAQVRINVDWKISGLVVPFHKSAILAVGVIIFQSKLNVARRGYSTTKRSAEAIPCAHFKRWITKEQRVRVGNHKKNRSVDRQFLGQRIKRRCIAAQLIGCGIWAGRYVLYAVHPICIAQ